MSFKERFLQQSAFLCPSLKFMLKPNQQNNAIILGSGAFQKWLGHQSIATLTGEIPRLFHDIRYSKKTAIYKPESKQAIIRHWISWHLDLGPFSLQNCEKWISGVYKPPIHGLFTRIAWTILIRIDSKRISNKLIFYLKVYKEEQTKPKDNGRTDIIKTRAEMKQIKSSEKW